MGRRVDQPQPARPDPHRRRSILRRALFEAVPYQDLEPRLARLRSRAPDELDMWERSAWVYERAVDELGLHARVEELTAR